MSAPSLTASDSADLPDGPASVDEAPRDTTGVPPCPGVTGPADESAADAMALIQLGGLIRDTFTRAAEQHDLTPVQARMLCVLAKRPHGMAELARLFGVGKASLTGLVDRAAARDLVERSLVPGDRRVIQVVLTDTGRHSALAFHQTVVDGLNQLLAPLAPQARADLRASATAVADAAGASGIWAAHQSC
ncbi:MarR family winged helix-turn-helix transcriptional regulator [Streptomyces sp. NPDC096354]|uniref:MarR family winged helix-turn-helix transcriptional regulator n=1 Tax=Streptomyces sp. NPDC096354 TaxID=3366088 RepID=UPI00380AFE35